MTLDQRPEAIADSLRDVLIKHGLHQISAATSTHVIEVREPSWHDETVELAVEIRTIDI